MVSSASIVRRLGKDGLVTRRLTAMPLIAATAAILIAGGGAATAYAQIVDGMPAGAIIVYAGASEPPGWLFADGREVSRTVYPELYAAIGTTYGAGDGSTTFNLPNLKSRFPLGKADSGTGSTLGGAGGALDHTHTAPSHTHSQANHDHPISHTHSVPGHHHDRGTLSVSSAGSHNHGGQTASSTVSLGKMTSPNGQVVNNGLLEQWNNGYQGAFTGGAHSHSIPTDGTHGHGLLGLIGNTASGNNGDASLTTASQSTTTSGLGGAGSTGAPSASVTTSANPPYLVVNYLIRSGRAL